MRKLLSLFVIFTIPILFFLSLVLIYNYCLDPYGVIKGDMTSQITEPNQHYLKVKYCIDYPKKHNAFLFGSSSVGKINISNFTDSNNWYNFSYSESVPKETLEDLKILLKNNVKVERILIGLNEVSYMVNPKLHDNQSLRKPYVNIINPYLYYLFLKPSPSLYKSIKKAKKSIFYQEKSFEVIYTNGSFTRNKKDTYIDENSIFHLSEPVFDKPYWNNYYENRIEETINDIKAINELCEINNIEVTYFLNPIYDLTYRKALSNGFLEFWNELSKVTSFYDFTGINKMTSNRLNFYENSHYRPKVGDYILSEISSNSPKHQVNKNNSIQLYQLKVDEAQLNNILID